MGTPEGEEETPLTLGILFSLDRCLLMGDPNFFPRDLKAFFL